MGNVHPLPGPGAANDPAGLQPARSPALQLLAPVRFVTIDVASVLTGFTVRAIQTKIDRGQWLEGRQYVRRDGRVLIDLNGVHQWSVATTLSPEQKLERTVAVKNFHRSKRRATQMQRTPAWADMTVIRGIYVEARRLTRETGVPHHVDHEIPLQGELVSGLHVHNNLQILTGSENSKKRNRFEIEP